jgi:hypothetical protein
MRVGRSITSEWSGYGVGRGLESSPTSEEKKKAIVE